MLTQPVATIVAALIAAFLGSWLGAATALSRFRKERAFDRRLDWYERMIRSLHDLAQKIEVAQTFDDGTASSDIKHRVWEDVQKAHLKLDVTVVEAELYGSDAAVTESTRILDKVQAIADDTDGFDPPGSDMSDRVAALPDALRLAARPLALEARRHLRLS